MPESYTAAWPASASGPLAFTPPPGPLPYWPQRFTPILRRGNAAAYFFPLGMPNEFSQTIPPQLLIDVQQQLDNIKTALAPYLISLTPEERRTMLRMADKTVAFVQKTSDYAAHNPDFVPGFVDLNELTQDVAGINALTPLRQQFEQLATDTDSTMMVAGGEAYASSLTIYNNIKFLAKNKQPGAQTAYDDLSQRFPGRPTTAVAAARRKA